MISTEKRAQIKEAARWMTIEQVATQFQVCRQTVVAIKKGEQKGAAWEPRRKQIAEDSKTMTPKELAVKYGVSKSRVYDILKKEKG